MTGERELRCHKCSGFLQTIEGAVLLAVLFKQNRIGGVREMPRVHANETRVRCRRCCWTNVFVPIGVSTRERIELKAVAG